MRLDIGVGVDETPTLDIVECRRRGWLEEGATFEWSGTTFAEGKSLSATLADALRGHTLKAAYDGERLCLTLPGSRKTQYVEIVWTDCYYGGEGRPCFFCAECGKQVRKLYWTGKDMRCRTCAGLRYACRREASYDRALRRAKRAYQCVATLGWCLEHKDILEFPPKPKGMHWKTYARYAEIYAEGLTTFLEHHNQVTARLRAASQKSHEQRDRRRGRRS